ncbi:MAG: LuxR C-terminal-related transcriptional regulator [Gaiellaceae bacterium]
MASALLPRATNGSADAVLRVQHDQATVRVVIACDDALLGKGLRALLEGEGLRAYFVDSFARAGRFCSLEQGGQREVVVWVLDTVGPDTVAAAREFLATRQAGLCLLAKTVPLEHLRALVLDRPTSFGVLLRGPDADPADIAAMINQVAIAGLSIDESLLRQMLRPRPATESDLTPTEQRVLDMVSSGWRNREIARRLGRSEKAIENHIGRLFAKLGLDAKLHPHIDRRVTAALLHAECASARLALYSQERDGLPPRARSTAA